MDSGEVTQSDDMSVMVGVVVTSLAIVVASLWLFYRRRARNGRKGAQEGKGQKDKQLEKSHYTPLRDAGAGQEEEREEEEEEEDDDQSFS
ncbi:hypothetical protein COCON_G00054360 [Conger conger]|uniref:Uncharacterized protein n=1 Tax=Conger conger TaxID=82655 RepID=A0A9Q1DW59_CONCO|nr:hypothetical protein COCON_G00054360 [Conger conger]